MTAAAMPLTDDCLSSMETPAPAEEARAEEARADVVVDVLEADAPKTDASVADFVLEAV